MGFKGIARKTKISRPLTYRSRGKLIVSPIFLQLELVWVRELNCHLQELSANPHYVIGAPMWVMLSTLVHIVHIEQNKSSHNPHTTISFCNGPHPQAPEEASPHHSWPSLSLWQPMHTRPWWQRCSRPCPFFSARQPFNLRLRPPRWLQRAVPIQRGQPIQRRL